MSLLTEASLVILPNAVEEGELFSIIPTDGSGDMTAVRATTATLVNSERLIESVAINVPRLDYTNGSCPSILVEPQRTNLATYSEQFDNVIWSKLAGASIVINTTISPIGTLTADTLNFDTQIGSRVEQQISLTTLGSYTFSFYAKSDSLKTVGIRTGILGSATINVQVTTEWQKFSVTQTLSVAGLAYPQIRSIDTLGGSIYIWGAQLEAGANATSYIPTVASAVTRNADVISKTGISDLIGQTEGTIFVDCKNVKNGLSRLFEIFNSSNTSTNIFLNITSAGGLQMVLNNSTLPVAPTINVNDLGKFIFKYTENSIKIFNNGVLVGTYLGTISFANELNTLSIGGTTYTPRTINGEINLVVLFKTALTDQQCINLTSI